jgi:hypothetical protein
MAVYDGGGGGEGSDPADQGGSADQVKVNITGMLAYYLEMRSMTGDASEVNIAISELAPLIQNGLNGIGPLGEVFPEGAQVAASMVRRQHDFTSFLADVNLGLMSISSAAAVIAEMYGDGDFHSAATLSNVGFAFGDYGATPPEGFRRDAQTWSQYLAEQQGSAYPLALMGDKASATHYQVASGVDIYTYPDGSSIQVVTTTRDGRQVTETTIFGPNHQALQKTTVESYTQPDGTRVQSTSVTQGTQRDGSTSETVRATAPNGEVTITNKTTTVVDGGKPVQTESEPVVVPPGDHTVPVDRGPIEEAQDELDSHGGGSDIEQYGYRP